MWGLGVVKKICFNFVFKDDEMIRGWCIDFLELLWNRFEWGFSLLFGFFVFLL